MLFRSYFYHRDTALLSTASQLFESVYQEVHFWEVNTTNLRNINAPSFCYSLSLIRIPCNLLALCFMKVTVPGPWVIFLRFFRYWTHNLFFFLWRTEWKILEMVAVSDWSPLSVCCNRQKSKFYVSEKENKGLYWSLVFIPFWFPYWCPGHLIAHSSSCSVQFSHSYVIKDAILFLFIYCSNLVKWVCLSFSKNSHTYFSSPIPKLIWKVSSGLIWVICNKLS